MHTGYLPRRMAVDVAAGLRQFPAVALIGPRQCGKTTLAKAVIARRPSSVYLDLERPSDLQKLSTPELFLSRHTDRLVCLDEIQRAPDLFPVLRGLIDEKRRPGRFLILGSASPDLLRQSSESLAGRVHYLELTPFLNSEVTKKGRPFARHWVRGGYPDSYLARSDIESLRWRQSFVRTFLERDIPQLGSRVPARTLERLWRMCAHNNGQLLNQSRLGEALGLSHTTIRSYLDLLASTFMIRLLPPLLPSLRKRLVKSPRIYLRDTGLLHALLDIQDEDGLLGHPARGASWEGWVIENVLAGPEGWRGCFYRATTGAELDLVIERGRRRVAVECKASSAPNVTPGFWTALKDLGVREAWVVAPVRESYPIAEGVTVAPLAELLTELR